MFNYIVSYVMTSTNYSVINTNNVYNCIISTMAILSDEQKREFIKIIKINIGKTFCHDLRNYLFEKVPDSELLKFF